MLPARDGDCMVIEYGEPGQVRRVMVDGGRASTSHDVRAYFGALPEAERVLQLLVVTHVDADHIEGALKLAADRPPAFACRDVWFNSFDHLNRLPGELARETFSVAQGDKFSAAAAATRWPLNKVSGGDAIAVAADGSPIRFDLDGGLALTVLSPDRARLLALRRHWARVVAQANLHPSQVERPEPPEASPGREAFGGMDVERLALRPDRPDGAVANGSSIALLAEHAGKRLLLSADAHPDILVSSLARLSSGEGSRFRVDLLKAPHHGSASNLTRALIEAIDCTRFVFSTDGTNHGHPDDEAMAKVLKFAAPGRAKWLAFNYRKPGTLKWDDAGLKDEYCYDCVFPKGSDNGRLDIDV